MFKKIIPFFVLALLLFIPLHTSAISISTSVNDKINIIVTDFVAPATLTVTHNNTVLYTETRDDGNFQFNLDQAQKWGILDVLIVDGNGNNASSYIYFNYDNSAYDEVNPTQAPSPTPAPKTYKVKLEFPVNQKYMYLMNYVSGIWDPLSNDYFSRMKITMDVKTIFNERNDRVLIPVRFFAEALGYNVNWDQPTRSISIVSADTTVSMQIGSNYLLKNKDIIKMDEPLQIHEDRTYLPVRFVGEAFGFDVYWDAPPQRVLLYK